MQRPLLSLPTLFVGAILLLGVLLLRPTVLEADPDAGERMQLIHSVAVHPAGSGLVVSWRGDLWWVQHPARNRAERLTFHPAMEREPRISPDGRTLAFVSDRSGSRQVYTMPLVADAEGAVVRGGTPRQISTLTEGFSLEAWTPDGSALLVRTVLDGFWRDAARLALRPIDPDRPLEVLMEAYADAGSLSADGRYLVYAREGGPWFRKGHQGPAASQIWIHDREAGTHRQISKDRIEERMPRWNQDGTRIWFVSEDDGTYNLWSMKADGSDRRQHSKLKGDGILRYDLAPPQGERKSARIVARTGGELFEIDAARGAVERLDLRYVGPPINPDIERRTQTRATAAAFTDDGREIAFVAGGDIWVMDTELKEPVQVTDTPWHESAPVFSPDHETLYYVTEFAGQVDIASVTRGDPERWWWQNDTFVVTRMTETPEQESDLRISPNKKEMTWSSGRGDLWIAALDGSEARPLLEGWNTPSYDISPDGLWIAYAVDDDDFNRDVWIRRIDGEGEPFNLSLHPDYDDEPRWSPDGRLLAFTSRRRDDEIDVHYVYLRQKDHEEGSRERTLKKAIEKMAKRKKKKDPKKADKPADPKAAGADTPKKEEGVAAKPLGPDALLGTWNGTLKGDPPVPAAGIGFQVEVSRGEDGALVLAVRIPGQLDLSDVPCTFDPDNGTMRFEAKTPMGPMTAKGTLKGNVLEGSWQIEGGLSGTFRLELEAEATEEDPKEPAPKPDDEKKDGEAGKGDAKKEPKKKEKGPKPIEIDFEDIEDRIRRISIPDSVESGLLWSGDGKTLMFRASPKGERGLYKVVFPDKLRAQKVSTTTGSNARWLQSTKQIAWLAGGQPALMTAAGRSTSYGVRCYQERSITEEHKAIFDAAWRTMRDFWYDPAHGGKDWDAVYARYAPYAAVARTRYELWTVANLMLGELNGSHLGFSTGGMTYSAPGWRMVTGHLGVHLEAIEGQEGMRITHVVPGGPADQVRSRLKVGEVILSIDGDPIDGSVYLPRLLTKRAGSTCNLFVRGEDGKERDVLIRPVTYGAIRSLLYEAWVEASRKRVTDASEGRLGYLHIRGMNWPSFQRFEQELYKVGHGKDGLVIDVRDNGGGFTADHLLTCLTQPVHAFTVPRGGGIGYPQGRMVYARWHKPIIVLCNQNSFSNAEIFSHAIKTLGRGRVVGIETAGGVISTGRATLLGGLGSVRLPFRGWFLSGDGQDMEHNGCVPDIIVALAPGDRSAGRDGQLDTAVKALLEDVAKWKANPLPKPVRATERK